MIRKMPEAKEEAQDCLVKLLFECGEGIWMFRIYRARFGSAFRNLGKRGVWELILKKVEGLVGGDSNSIPMILSRCCRVLLEET